MISLKSEQVNYSKKKLKKKLKKLLAPPKKKLSAVDQILQIVDDIYAGKHPGGADCPWLEFDLSPEDKGILDVSIFKSDEWYAQFFDSLRYVSTHLGHLRN